MKLKPLIFDLGHSYVHYRVVYLEQREKVDVCSLTANRQIVLRSPGVPPNYNY